MDFIKSFTRKNMALNKRRTIVTIIGVLLSSALICAVVGMAASFWESLKQNEIQTSGLFHVEFMHVESENLALVSENVNVKRAGAVTTIGSVPVTRESSDTKRYITLCALDTNAYDMLALELSSGRLPANENELLVPPYLGLSVGDTIELEIGDIHNSESDDSDSSSENTVEASDASDISSEDAERFVLREKRTYTVVGIMQRISSWVTGYGSPEQSLLTFGDVPKGSYANVFAEFHKPRNAFLTCYQISDTLEKTGYGGGFVVSDLAKFQGSLGFAMKKTLSTLVAIVLGIILVMSVLVIGNSFRISVTEKISQYGMLTSIGATKRQIRRTVLLEGFYIGSIGIVSGILLGVGVDALLVVIVNMLMSDVVNLKLVFALPWWVIPVTILVSALTVYLSCLLPAAQAARISPIEAIRGNNEIGKGISRRRIRTGRLVSKIFGIGGVIALKNLKRSRRKYRTTVVSLVVGVSVFIGLSSFINLGFGLVNTQYAKVGYDIEVHPAEIRYTDMSQDILALYRCIGDLPFADKVWFYNECALLAPVEGQVSEEMKDYMKDWFDNGEDPVCSTSLLIMNRDNFAEYASRVGIKKSDLSKEVILTDQYLAHKGEKTHRFRVYKLSEGDTLTLRELSDSEDAISDITYSLDITKVTDVWPVGFENSYSPGGLVIVSEDYFDQSPRTILNKAYIESSKPDKLVTEIDKLLDETGLAQNVYINDISSEADGMHRLLITVSIFLYGFIIVITLIGVTNVINTVTTNMNLRAPEFAMLKSVGMTGREFNRMIRLESLMYGAKSLCIGIPLGIALSFWISHSFARAYVEAYKLPVAAIIECIVFVALIVGFTMKYAVGKINRQNIMETIRKQNI